MDRWLVSLDTDRVKEYVFATGRLREIRGASAILDHLNRHQTEALIAAHNGRKVFVGGGSAMASFDDEDQARAFQEAVVGMYSDQTAAATISGIRVSYDPAADFRPTFKKAARLLRRAKDAGRRPPGMLTVAWMSRCQRCGEYPVVRRLRLPGNVEVGLCAACALKRRAADDPTFGPAAHLHQTGAVVWSGLHVPEELSEVGRSSPANHIGFIYADGNGLGRLIEDELTSEGALREFSRILEESILAAVAAAVGPAVANGLPIVPVLIGGDDVILITPAQVALPAAARLCVAFGEEIASRLDAAVSAQSLRFEGEAPQVTMSAGVALAKASHPIFALRELAEDLQVSAKRQSADLRRLGLGQQPTLDFRVISSSSANTWDQVRKRELRLPIEDPLLRRWATARPYPCRRIDGLNRPTWPVIEEAIHSLRAGGFPRNKLQLWQTILQSDYSTERSLLEVRLLHSRLSPSHRELISDVAGRLAISDPLDLFLTDPLQPINEITPLPDIVELYDFLG